MELENQTQPNTPATNFFANNPSPLISNIPSNTPPPTQSNPLIVSSAPAQREFNNYSLNLSKYLSSLTNPMGQQNNRKVDMNSPEVKNDPYMKLLNERSLLDNEATKALVATINASKYSAQKDATQMYDSYKRGMQLLGIQSNEAEFTPDLLMGKTTQIESQKQAKLQQYEVEAMQNLIEARRAQADGDLKLLREKMNRVEEIQKEREDYLINLANNLQAETEIADNRAEVIYDTLQTLSPNEQESFLNQVADQFGIPVISLISALERQRVSRKKTTKSGTGGSGTKITPTPTNKRNLSGVGFSTQDIDDIYKLVNESSAERVYQLLKNDGNYTEAQLSVVASVFGITEESSETGFDKIKPAFKGEKFKRRRLRKGTKVTKKLRDVGIDLTKLQKINEKMEEGFSIQQIAQQIGLTQTQVDALIGSLEEE